MIFIAIALYKKLPDQAVFCLCWFGVRMRWLIVLGGIMSVASWAVLTFLIPATAHEGVTLVTNLENTISAMITMTPLYIFIAFVTLYLLLRSDQPDFLLRSKITIPWVYLIAFIIASVAISYYTDLRNLPANEIVFHIFHGFHSIFTLGTVICLDLIFVSTQNAPFAQKHIVPLFPQISKVIWVGLSLDLMSTLLIYPDAIVLSSRFYFAQIVVGILIINGILLSGAITRRMLKNVEEGHKERTRFWEKLATVAGAISITSWMAINFVDQFHDLSAPLFALFIIYLATIVVIIIGHELWSKHDREAEALAVTHAID